MKEKIKESYGFLFEEDLIDEIVAVAQIKEIKQEEVLMDYHQTIRFMPLLLSGAIKVMREDKEGDELVLYYLEKGDSCTMTMNCCIGQQKSEIRAVAELDSTIILIPVEKMKQWIVQYNGWLTFVFESYNNRFNELLDSIDNLAFNNLHERVFKYIKDKVLVNKSTSITISHQEIARDMHSSRVVISRLLKSLENEKRIKLGRNKIELLDF